MAGGVDTVQVRHGDVHHDDVRLQLLAEPNGLPAVSRLGYYFKIFLFLEQPPQAFSHNVVVIRQYHFNHAGHPLF
jgi:hypothetical protein